MTISHTRILLARTSVLATLAFGLLAASTLSLGAAGAASSGGVSTEGSYSQEPRDRYSRIWDRTKKRHKRWARKTAECESGRDPKAIGGGGIYRGAFQFMKSTWKSAPKSPGGDPIKHPYRTQAVVAIALKRKDGPGHWPVCG